jgi:hypothetical protein
MCFSSFFGFCTAQEPNLVPNGGFEEYIQCPSQGGQGAFAASWFIPSNCTPELFHICANEIISDYGVPCNFGSNSVYPYEGNGMIGLGLYGVKEYLSTKLTEPLLYNQYYETSVQLRPISTCCIGYIGSFGTHFSIDSISEMNVDHSTLSLTPSLNHDPSVILSDVHHWFEYIDTLLANGGELFLTIGNFLLDSETPFQLLPGGLQMAYYFIDDVSVKRVDPPNRIKDYEQLNFELYPNPTTTTVAISHKSNRRISTVTITDLSGRDLQSHGGAVREIDVSGLNNGVYMARAQFENGAVAVRKLVVQRE